MRLLADENVPRPSIKLLRETGHEIEAVEDHEPGSLTIVRMSAVQGTTSRPSTFPRTTR